MRERISCARRSFVQFQSFQSLGGAESDADDDGDYAGAAVEEIGDDFALTADDVADY